MRTKVIFLFTGLILATGLALYGFLENYYIETKAYRDARILWNNKEAFVFVGKEISGFAGNRVGFVLGSLIPMHTLGTDYSSAVIVIHLDKTGCSVYSQNEFSQNEFKYAGNPLIYNGKLYFENSVNEGESLIVWKWSGTNFTKLEPDEANKILNSFTLFDDLLKKEGWNESEIWFDAKGTNISLPLQSVTYELSFKRDEEENEEQELVSLKNGTNTDKEREIVKITREMRKVGKSEYLDQFPSHSNQ